MRFEDYIVVADRLEPEWRRCVVGHAIGHCILHPGNHLWIRRHTDLARAFEREAEDFAYALFVDATEAAAEGLVYSWEVAEYSGVPDELVRLRTLSFPRGSGHGGQAVLIAVLASACDASITVLAAGEAEDESPRVAQFDFEFSVAKSAPRSTEVGGERTQTAALRPAALHRCAGSNDG